MNKLRYILLFTFLLSVFSMNAGETKNIVEYNKDIVTILKDAEVYPNPAEDFVYLKLDEQKINKSIEIQVMSIIGTKMNSSAEKIDDGLYKINLKNIPSGHYYVMITIDSKKSLKKFLKK
ncbi:T9SS type A sorting domain-containing protein [Marivirga arenosa]|uniref:T9SS type A sorting domain-containing protein n=1 Tax=Marivirga arenosa TaxID=3059076 RepID=A0AA49GCB3_9BACT|nr:MULTISPECIES: T9SS type A sorting domain-containing protein [unclassified Marivirga]WKK81418.2 T9SS type A sorting domain-containing protein [Marivirga sp. BKB1-2]WKK83560.1 T9SS type A sorting domain-containing protein [Marivirga sp. ABR2-2]